MQMTDDANTHTENINVSNFIKVGEDIYITLDTQDGNGTQLIWLQ